MSEASKAPERIWLAVDRKGKICGVPGAHVEPCDEVKSAYHEYVLARAAPTVKPLEWECIEGIWCAYSIVGEYEVAASLSNHGLWRASDPMKKRTYHDTKEAAMEALGFKNEHRILSALK